MEEGRSSREEGSDATDELTDAIANATIDEPAPVSSPDNLQGKTAAAQNSALTSDDKTPASDPVSTLPTRPAGSIPPLQRSSTLPTRMSTRKARGHTRSLTVDVGALQGCDSSAPIELFTSISNWLPPIIDTGGQGPFVPQPGDWRCCSCDYTVRYNLDQLPLTVQNWRRRTQCKRCGRKFDMEVAVPIPAPLQTVDPHCSMPGSPVMGALPPPPPMAFGPAPFPLPMPPPPPFFGFPPVWSPIPYDPPQFAFEPTYFWPFAPPPPHFFHSPPPTYMTPIGTSTPMQSTDSTISTSSSAMSLMEADSALVLVGASDSS